MVLRYLMRLFLNNEQLVQKLSESYPIKRAAQLTAYFIHKGREIGEDRLEDIKNSATLKKLEQDIKQGGVRFTNFKIEFKKELHDGFEEMKEKSKKKGS